ncbi:MAG TPA: hypothetical protein VKC66_01930 [Xanthobacteraceae bacterium]|nr:hypothetical protein [Xanthobacteraceae bacterium]
MHEVLDFSNLVIGSGCLSIMAGILQLFCHTLEVRPAKRGRIRATLNLRKWSFRATALGVIMIAIGALLLGGFSIE